MTERPTTPAEALRAVARWFDIHYPQDINTEIQDDLRKWATEIERLVVSEVSLKLDNEVISRRLATRDRALADQEIRMDCVLCWKHAQTHKSSIPCHKCQEERITELEEKLASLAEAGTGYSQETMDAVIQERARLAQELLESEKAHNALRVSYDSAQKTINYLRQQITIYAADAIRGEKPQEVVEDCPKERHLSCLKLSVRGRKCMIRLGITTIGELISKSADDLLQCKDFSQASLNEIREKLATLNLKLRGD